MNYLIQNEQIEQKKCYWFAQIKDDILFILKNEVISLNSGSLIKEDYRNSIYYRYPGMSKRIAQKTLKNRATRTNVLI